MDKTWTTTTTTAKTIARQGVRVAFRAARVRIFVFALALVVLGVGLVSASKPAFSASASAAEPVGKNGGTIASPACSPDWQVVPSSNFEINYLTSVAAISSNDVWAVGYYEAGYHVYGLTEHWNGTQWSIVPSFNPGGQYGTYLTSVAAISSNDVWAVGYYGGVTNQTLTEHWNGTQWSIVTSPNQGTIGNALTSVAAVSSNDVWAVGVYTTGAGGDQTLTEHWNGTQWSIVSSPNQGTGENGLLSVAAISSTDVWAVGNYRNLNVGADQTLTEHWNGTQWSIVSSPNQGIGDSLLSVAAVSSTDVWAAGEYANTPNVGQTLVEHWNGTQWSIVSSPNPGTGYNYLTSVAAISSSDVWAVGTNGNTGAALAEHWDGSAWSIVSNPNQDGYFYGVSAVSSNDVWAVGTNGNTGAALAEHWDGSAWSIVASPIQGTDYRLNSVAAVSSSDAWAVGYYHYGFATYTLIENWDGNVLRAYETPDQGTGSNALNGVAAVSSTDVWAVGYYNNGTVDQTLTEHWNGTSWSVVLGPNQGSSVNHLSSVAAISSNDVWAVGYYYDTTATAYQTLTEHWNGTSWSVVASPNPDTHNDQLNGVAAVSSNDVWAVGYYLNQTLVEHWDGTSWSIVTSPNPSTYNDRLFSVAAISSTDVWAVGIYDNDSGTTTQTLAEHWDGTSWSVVTSPNPTTSSEFTSVAAVSSNDVWAVGLYLNGSAFVTLAEHWDGSAWSVVTSPNPSTATASLLTSVAAVSSTDVLAVGYYYNGTVDQTLVESYNPCPSTSTPTPTSTDTAVPPTDTPTDTPTETPVPPSDTPTDTPTATDTPIPPTATATATNTPAPPTVTPTATNTPVPPSPTPTLVPQGCASGFWQGGLGSQLWNQPNDPDWTTHGGQGTNPYQTTTQFNSFFTPYPGFGTITMLQILGSGGTNSDARKAARDVVAGYLNTTFGLNYPYSTSQVAGMWTNAVNSGNFKPVHNLLGAANSQQCPIH